MIVSPSVLTSLIAVRELAREPGATIIHNLITSRAVPEFVAEHGGTAVRTRVGHSFIKAVMAERGAIFGGEHSGHFYFRDFWRADSGMLAALHVLAALGTAGQPLSQLLDYHRYIESARSTPRSRPAAVDQTAADVCGLRLDARCHHRRFTAYGRRPDWWFNPAPPTPNPAATQRRGTG